MRLRRVAALALLVPVAALAGWPIGSQIGGGVLADVTDEGFQVLSDMLPSLIPKSIPIPDIAMSGYDDYEVFGVTIWWWSYDFTLTNAYVGMEITNAEITPQTGVLAFTADTTLWANEAADPMYLDLDVEDGWGILGFADTTCGTYISPFNVWLSSTISLNIVDDGVNPPYLDATMGTIEWSTDLANEDVNLDCWIGDILDFFDWLGIDLIGMIIDLAYSQIDSLVQDFRPDIEAMIEDAFGALSIQEQLDLNGTTMAISVAPDSIEITPQGVRMSLGGSFASDTHECVSEYGHYESMDTPSDAPPIGSAPASIPAPHHFGAIIDDDFANQGLFAAYNGGLLCYKLSAGDGLPIDTTLLSFLGSDIFGPYFPETQPMIIQTRPAEVPTVVAKGEHDLNVQVRKLGLDFMAELEYRNVNMLGADLDVDAGVDFSLDPTTGNLALGLALSGDDLTTTVRHNEFAVGRDEEIAENFTGLFDTIAGPLLGGLTDGLGFGLPSFSGFGLTSLDAAPSGPSEDRIGIYGTLGPVSYEGGGCGSDGGGCSTGCGTSGGTIPARAVTLLLFPLALAGLRRRK
jgi:hypothetical protein